MLFRSNDLPISCKWQAARKRTDALKLLRRRLGELGIGRFVGPAAERVTIEQLIDLVEADYELKERRSLKRVRHARVSLLEEFGPDAALEVGLPRLEDYVARRRRDGAALATIQYELAILRRGYTLAVRRQLLPLPACLPYPSDRQRPPGVL